MNGTDNQKRRIAGIIPDQVNPTVFSSGLLKTYKESNDASNRELERNFPGSVSPPVPSKERIMTDARLTIAKPRGISTIAGNNSTPFVPTFQGTPTPAAAAANNVWTDTLKQANQPLTPSPAVRPPPITVLPTASGPEYEAAKAKLVTQEGAAPKTAAPEFTATNPGGNTIIGNPRNYSTPQHNIATPAVRRLGITDLDKNSWSDGSANVALVGLNNKYNNEVAAATRNNAIEKDFQKNRSIAGRINDLQSGNTTWDMKPESIAAAALSDFNAAQKGIADDKALEGHQYTADQGLAGHKYTADTSLAGVKYKADEALDVAKVKAKSDAITKQTEDNRKDQKDVIKNYFDAIKHLALPPGFEGQHMSLAKDLANAQDPATDFAIYQAPGSSRQGIAAKRSIFEPLLAKYTKAGYPLGDAHANAYRDLVALESQQRTSFHKPFPNLDILRNRDTKPAETTFGG